MRSIQIGAHLADILVVPYRSVCYVKHAVRNLREAFEALPERYLLISFRTDNGIPTGS